MRENMKWIMVIVVVALACGAALFFNPVISAEEMMTVDPDDLFMKYTDNEDSFVLFPGTMEMQEGNSPHGAVVTILVNDVALASIEAENDVFDYGSHIVKKNYTPDGELAAYTDMIKIEGYDPIRGDWYWVKYDADGTVSTAEDGTILAGETFKVMAEEKESGCIACHSAVSDTDWVFSPF